MKTTLTILSFAALISVACAATEMATQPDLVCVPAAVVQAWS
jgi:hypothetical protein